MSQYEIQPEWVHIAYAETSQFREVYGFAGAAGMVNLEGIRFLPKGKPSKTLAVYMHPATTLQLLPMPQAMAKAGVHVLCAGSRFMKNDTPLIMEKVVLDLGAYIRHAKEKWGYEKILLCGWSGGGSLSLFYQQQAEKPSITQTPAGDPVDLKGAKLIPADAFIFQAAHLSRAHTFSEWIDPSVIDEADPDTRNLEFDIYNPKCPTQPPYSADDAVPQSHTGIIYNAAASKDKTMRVIKGATHYYQGQPELLKQAVDLCVGWMDKQRLID